MFEIAIALTDLMTNLTIREDMSLNYKDFQHFTSKSGKNEDVKIQNNDTNENKFRKLHLYKKLTIKNYLLFVTIYPIDLIKLVF